MAAVDHHDAWTSTTLATINHFNDAFNRHDVDALMALMSDDCVFENTAPAPDGTRYAGQAAVRACWQQFFASSPRARFTWEETLACGDRGVVRWRYDWLDADGTAGHVRGIDLLRVRDGKVVEKLSYVKG